MDAELFKAKCELLKFRAEEIQRNYLSLRVVEWRIAFQSYAGYGAVALVFNALKSENLPLCRLGTVMVVVAVALYFTSLYFSVRLQERLHFLREAQNKYIDALHHKLKVAQLEADAEDTPIHKGWYAFKAFQMVHITVFLGLLSYVALKSASVLVTTMAIASGPLAIAVLLVAPGWYRVHSGRFKNATEDEIWGGLTEQ